MWSLARLETKQDSSAAATAVLVPCHSTSNITHTSARACLVMLGRNVKALVGIDINHGHLLMMSMMIVTFYPPYRHSTDVQVLDLYTGLLMSLFFMHTSSRWLANAFSRLCVCTKDYSGVKLQVKPCNENASCQVERLPGETALGFPKTNRVGDTQNLQEHCAI